MVGKTEDYNPGTSLWRGEIIDIISDETKYKKMSDEECSSRSDLDKLKTNGFSKTVSCLFTKSCYIHISGLYFLKIQKNVTSLNAIKIF